MGKGRRGIKIMGNSTKGIDLSGTHLPVLAKLLSVTNGAVLELGAGYNSTPLLYWTCKADGRHFESYENYKDWCDKMGEFTKYTDDWNKLDIDSRRWSMVLIDLRPALSRKDQAKRLMNNADFIILHDSEPEIDRFYKYSWIYKHFKFRYDFTRVKPNTTILSNFIDPNTIFKT